SPWVKRFGEFATGICSGWMQVRGNVRRRNADAGFALSDHADWNGLLDAIRATGAESVFVTHGFQSALSRFLNEQGIPSAEVKTEYGEDEEAQGGAPEDGTTVADEEAQGGAPVTDEEAQGGTPEDGTTVTDEDAQKGKGDIE